MRYSTGLCALTLTLTLFVLVGCGNSVELHSGLSERDANEVVAALMEHGVSARKRGRENDVSVEIREGDITRAVQVLNARGLPSRHRDSMGEIFQKEGLISSPMEEQARYIYALSQELEHTLSQIQDVIVARVHVVLPDQIAPGEEVQLSSAAVFIKHLPSLDPDVVRPRVRELVSRSIPGARGQRADDISIVFTVGDDVTTDLEWARVGPFRVDAASAGILQLTAGFFLVSLIALAGSLVFTLRHRIRPWILRTRSRIERLLSGNPRDP